MAGNLEKILGGPLFFNKTPAPPETQLRVQMAQFDLYPEVITLDGNLHRFQVEQSKDAGWYVAFGDGVPAGKFGNWKTGEEVHWRADVGRELTVPEQMAHSRRMAEIKEIRDQALIKKHETASSVVQKIWELAGLASDEHPYLKKKGVKAHGLRITGDGRLIAPLYSDDGTLSSIQYITGDGDKQYHPGGAVKYCSYTMGVVTDFCYIVEGYATGATVYETTRKPVVVAYSAGNLLNMAEVLRKKSPSLSMTIVADNDESGVGQAKAEQAAAKYGATVIMPPILGDANDFVQGGGDLVSLLGEVQSVYDRLHVFTGDSISEEYEPPDELVEDLLTSETLSMIYGESHSGKTFFAISLGVAVASSTPFFNKNTDGGKVIYLATEAPRTVKDRLQAIKRYQNVDLSNFYVVPMPLNFYSHDSDVYDVINLCKEVSGNVKLIIGDTLARMSAGANENSGDDMGPIMEKFDLVSKETGAAVVLIHHSGKNTERGARGWSGVRAHLDAEIEISAYDEQGAKTAKVTKQRELGTTGEEISFKLKVVDMGIGKFGSMKTSCIVEQDTTPRAVEKPKKIDVAYRLFENAWYASDMDVVDGCPYLTKSAFKNKLVVDGFGADRTIENHLSSAYSDKTIGMLLNSRIIESYLNGWTVVDNGRRSALLLYKNHVK